MRNTNSIITVNHFSNQREYHVLPCYEKHSESEIDVIAFEHNLENYSFIEKTVKKWTSEGWEFEYYTYILKY